MLVHHVPKIFMPTTMGQMLLTLSHECRSFNIQTSGLCDSLHVFEFKQSQECELDTNTSVRFVIEVGSDQKNIGLLFSISFEPSLMKSVSNTQIRSEGVLMSRNCEIQIWLSTMFTCSLLETDFY